MVTLSSLFRPKLGFAIGLYCLSLLSLAFLVQAQLDATDLLQAGRPILVK